MLKKANPLLLAVAVGISSLGSASNVVADSKPKSNHDWWPEMLDLQPLRQHDAAARETTEDGRRRENRRYQDAVLALSKAFALASASDEARDIRDEIAFFQTVRAALVKSADGAGRSATDRAFAIQQILDRAVVSTEIVDILAAAGITTPDISILSDDFLAEVQQLGKKNLALEALRKLLNDEIRSRSKTNVVETKRFSERLDMAIARYHANAISTVEVLQELIDLAKEVRAARRRGEDEGRDPAVQGAIAQRGTHL